MLSSRTKRQGLIIELNVQPGLEHVVVQPQSIQQVIINLVENAVDAINMKEPLPEDKTITIDVNRLEMEAGPTIQMEVKDNGIGMSPEVIKKAQDAFFTTKSSTEGTGLGLSIVKDLVLKHEGQVEIESQEGLYTKIIIRLPEKKMGCQNLSCST